MLFSVVMFPADEQKPPLQNREFDVGAYQFIRERGYPSLERCDLTPPYKSAKCALYQARCLREVVSCQRVVNGVVCHTLPLIPYARSPVEVCYQRWVFALQAMA